MGESSSSVNGILDFLKSNKFGKAEAALRSEMGNRGDDLNGFFKGLKLEEVMGKSSYGLKEEFVVKEMEYGNGPDSKWKNIVEEKNGVSETIGTRDKKYKSLNNSDEALLELYSRKFNSTNGSGDLYPNDSDVTTNDVKDYEVSSQSKTDTNRVNVKVGVEKDSFVDRKPTLIGAGSVNKVSGLTKPQSMDKVIESKENNHQLQMTGEVSVGDFMDNPWSRSDELKYSSLELWKDCPVKTVLSFPKGDASTSYDTKYGVGDKEGRIRKPDNFATTQGNIELNSFGGLGFPVISMKQKEELPRLPPVKLKSEDKPSSITWEEKHQRDGPGSKTLNADSSYHIGSFLDVPIGQEISSSGGKRHAGGNWFSVSQGITEDTSDPVSGLAIIADGLSESLDYLNDYWDSDEYDDDDDVGYMRQPIEDETWFLAHELTTRVIMKRKQAMKIVEIHKEELLKKMRMMISRSQRRTRTYLVTNIFIQKM